MSKFFSLVIMLIPGIGLSQIDSPISFWNVVPEIETTAVESTQDAADDICIWVPKEAKNTIIVGTDKKYGLETYNIKGEKLYRYPFGKLNNVDILSPTKGINSLPLLVATNRSSHSIDLFVLMPTGEIKLLSQFKINDEIDDVYGIASYTIDNHHYIVFNDKSGLLVQCQLRISNNNFELQFLGKHKLHTITEGVVVDTFHRKIYVNEENIGLWKIDLELNENSSKELVLSTDQNELKSDFEGVSIYDKGKGSGYVVLSVQGANQYALLDRNTNNLVGIFKILKSNFIDGVEETDGLDCTSKTVPGFPKGFLVVQDGYNGSENQNFKIINWKQVQKQIDRIK